MSSMTHSIPVVGVERVSQHDSLIIKAGVLIDQDLWVTEMWRSGLQ